MSRTPDIVARAGLLSPCARARTMPPRGRSTPGRLDVKEV